MVEGVRDDALILVVLALVVAGAGGDAVLGRCKAAPACVGAGDGARDPPGARNAGRPSRQVHRRVRAGDRLHRVIDAKKAADGIEPLRAPAGRSSCRRRLAAGCEHEAHGRRDGAGGFAARIQPRVLTLEIVLELAHALLVAAGHAVQLVGEVGGRALGGRAREAAEQRPVVAGVRRRSVQELDEVVGRHWAAAGTTGALDRVELLDEVVGCLPRRARRLLRNICLRWAREPCAWCALIAKLAR